jgi:predicted DsbA family dithiol-disulfide isomerase
MNKGTAVVGFILSFIAGMILIWGIERGSGDASATAEKAVDGAGSITANPGAVEVELYVMSQCPYGVQAEAAFKDVVAKFGKDINFKVEFIGQTAASGDLTSMHGANEVKGDMVQACAQKISPKWFEFVLCQNKNMKEVHTNWEACASEVGIPADKLGACLNGQEGKDLLAASFKKATEKGARGSPTILIGGKKHEGGRRAADLMKAICGAYTGAKPAACSSIPESPKVNVTFLSDKRCTECNTAKLEQQVKQKVANPVITNVDYSDPAGKKLYESIKPSNLPAVIFDKTLDADADAKGAFARGIKEVGEYKVMASGDYNPACADDGGCDLAECKPTMQCRPEEPGKIEVFVMSQCPYGVKGMDAMKEVIENFKKADAKTKLDFQIHFIGNYDDAKGLTSMHGQPEVDEDIREVCAIEHYKENYKFMDYIWCRNKDYKSTNWQSCTGGDTGIDTAVIQKCFEGEEGKSLLKKSFEFSKAAGIGSSPTWIANGKYKFSGIDAETVKTKICDKNKFPGCENKLSGPPPRPGAAAGGQPAAAPGCGG